MTVEASTGSFAEPGANWYDIVDGTGTLTISSSGTVNMRVPGVYTLTYTKVDAHNNTASISRSITVIDTTRPTLTLVWASSIGVYINTVYTDPGATRIDIVDGTGTIATYSGTVNTWALGTYTFQYRKTDTAWNISAIIARTIIVSTPPSAGGGSSGGGSSFSSVSPTPIVMSSTGTTLLQTVSPNIASGSVILAIDISKNKYKTAIEAMIQKWYIQNTKRFYPNRTITRSEFLKLLVQAYGYTGPVNVAKKFADIPNSGNLGLYVYFGVAKGWINTKNMNFRPNDIITQAEINKLISVVKWTATADTIVSSSFGVTRAQAVYTIVQSFDFQ